MEGVVTGFIGRGKGCGVCDWQPGLIGRDRHIGHIRQKVDHLQQGYMVWSLAQPHDVELAWCGVWLGHTVWSWA